jgi:5'-AMP-activated protein kinase regulatory gamma subunit
MQTAVFDVVHMFSELGISAVPIVDANGKVINLYETVDVIVSTAIRSLYRMVRLTFGIVVQTLLKLGTYQALDLTIAQALARRPVDFEGVLTCGPESSLASVFALIRMRRIHRLVVIDDGRPKEGESEQDAKERKGRLLGLISLSDVLRHVIVSRVRSKGLDT